MGSRFVHHVDEDQKKEMKAAVSGFVSAFDISKMSVDDLYTTNGNSLTGSVDETAVKSEAEAVFDYIVGIINRRGLAAGIAQYEVFSKVNKAYLDYCTTGIPASKNFNPSTLAL